MSYWDEINVVERDTHCRCNTDGNCVTESELTKAKDDIVETVEEYADEYTIEVAKEYAEELQSAYEQTMDDRATTFENGIDGRVTAVEDVANTANVNASNAVETANNANVTATEAKTTADLNNARLDTAIEAVTTDTEVTDIRNGAEGEKYTTAGSAVREQYNKLDRLTNHDVVTALYELLKKCAYISGDISNELAEFKKQWRLNWHYIDTIMPNNTHHFNSNNRDITFNNGHITYSAPNATSSSSAKGVYANLTHYDKNDTSGTTTASFSATQNTILKLYAGAKVKLILKNIETVDLSGQTTATNDNFSVALRTQTNQIVSVSTKINVDIPDLETEFTIENDYNIVMIGFYARNYIKEFDADFEMYIDGERVI